MIGNSFQNGGRLLRHFFVGHKNALMLVFSISLVLFFAEIGLRYIGMKPGVYVVSNEFKVVDSLVLYKNFYVDEQGIYKFSPFVTDSFQKYLNTETGLLDNIELRESLAEIDNFDMVYIDFMRLVKPLQRPFWKLRIKDWLAGNDGASSLSDTFNKQRERLTNEVWQRSLIHYVEHPFNTDGFRSIEFNNDTTYRPKVLLIGDSYVYGLSASPFHASFSDNLLAKGYMVYTAGIPGTDPAQYTAIAKKYIPKIRPDVVIMCFYEGNDYMSSPRECSAIQPIEYLTNAGFFQSAPYGDFLSMQECYTYYKSLISIPECQTNRLNRLMSKSVITSLVWGGMYKIGIVKHPIVLTAQSRIDSINTNAKPEYTTKHLSAFSEVCAQNKVPVIYTIIPQRDSQLDSISNGVRLDSVKAKKVFCNIPFLSPTTLKRELHYGKRDSHFNKLGAKIYSDFLDKCIVDCLNLHGQPK